jgi:transposase
MTRDGLFGELPEQAEPKRELGAGAPRMSEPERRKIELRAVSLDSLIGADHPARLMWAYVLRLDLRELEDRIKAREGVPGHPAISPRLLLALWLYATSEGVVSARLLARLCQSDDAYRWLCGEVGVNHRTLGEFRVEHGELLNRLLAEGVTALASEGLIDLDTLAQDGVRVRASAGASSFRSGGRLEELVADVKATLAELAKEADSDPAANEKRLRDRRERRAAERLARLEKAAAKVAEMEAGTRKSKPDSEPPADATVTAPPATDPPAPAAGAASDAEVSPSGKKPKSPRASTTDPEARVVKMPDGGFRPAYNMQIASVAGGQVVVAVDVSTSSSDRGLARPMLEKIEATYGKLPKQHLVDGGFGKNDDIEWAHGAKVAIHCPPTTNKHNTDPFAPREDDGPGVRAWRQRMQSEAGKATYRKRSIHECINARFRQWGLVQLTMRGRTKAAIVLTWHALANNILQGARLRQAAAAAAT